MQARGIIRCDVKIVRSVILDAERYPEFIGICKKVSLINQIGNQYYWLVDVLLFGSSISYRCIVVDNYKEITINIVPNDFVKSMSSRWLLSEIDTKQTGVVFTMDISFHRKQFDLLYFLSKNRLRNVIMKSFERRINDIATGNLLSVAHR